LGKSGWTLALRTPNDAHHKGARMFHSLWAQLALAMSALAGTAAFADARRMRRTNFDRVGFMPWTSISMLAITGAIISAAFALKGF
jgi:hypothetical protein